VILKPTEEKEDKTLLIFPGNYSDPRVWGILHCGGIQ
jgi:hypothetical protein